MHQRYSDFANNLVPALVKSFDVPGKSEADTVRKKRVILRLLCELYLAGVYTDTSVLLGIVKELVLLLRLFLSLFPREDNLISRMNSILLRSIPMALSLGVTGNIS